WHLVCCSVCRSDSSPISATDNTRKALSRADDEHRIHAPPATRARGLDADQPAIRGVFPAQLLRPHRGGRRRRVFVYAAFQLVRSSDECRSSGPLPVAVAV